MARHAGVVDPVCVSRPDAAGECGGDVGGRFIVRTNRRTTVSLEERRAAVARCAARGGRLHAPAAPAFVVRGGAPAPGDRRSVAHQHEVARRHRGSRPKGDEPEGVAGGAVALVEGGPLMARRRRPEGVTFADMPAHLRRFVPEAWLDPRYYAAARIA